MSLIIDPRLNGLQQLSPIPCHKTTGGEPDTAKVCVRQTTIATKSNIQMKSLPKLLSTFRDI